MAAQAVIGDLEALTAAERQMADASATQIDEIATATAIGMVARGARSG